MTIRNIIEKSIKELENSQTAVLDIELMLCEILNVDRLYIHINIDKNLDEDQIIRFNKMMNERKNGRPMAYILGVREFMGMDFFVKEGVLIPRPDTEILVEEIIDLCKAINSPTIVDIGTGSGAISVSLAKYIKDSFVYSLDISDIPLKVGKINAEKNEVAAKIKFLKSDIFSALENTDIKFDVVVSNPPYIRKKDIYDLDTDVKDYEPILALDGGDDGLVFYRKITKDSLKFLKDNGILGFEVGYDQAEEVKDIMIQNNFRNIKIIKDLAGIDRVVIGNKIWYNRELIYLGEVKLCSIK